MLKQEVYAIFVVFRGPNEAIHQVFKLSDHHQECQESQGLHPLQYLGSCNRKVSTRVGEHRRDIADKVKGKAVAEHFERIRSGVEDLVFIPFMRVRSDDPEVLRVLEQKYINDYNLIEAGINVIL